MLPDGLRTQLSSTGGPLSYGQARRLMFARAIAGKPRLLVIDDLLDDLDARARKKTLAVLLSPAWPWTLILLTHSEAVTLGFQRVIHMSHGRADDAARDGMPPEAA
mgnify:CR=1 FL=1